MAHSKAFCLTFGGLLATTGPSFILVRGTFGEDCHVCVREGEQPVDSSKNPDFVMNLGRFEVIAIYAAEWDPTLWVTLKTLALFQTLSYLFYVNSYYALRPLLIQDYEEWGLQI